MAEENEHRQPILTTTQRAYTLRLRPAVTSGDKDEIARKTSEMQSALWATHEAVNRGAKVFGDWLLTLRGGLDHKLTDVKIKGTKGSPDRDPPPEVVRNRRILLALSWLSVESAPSDDKAHAQNIVTRGSDSKSERQEALLSALHSILKSRQISDSEIGDRVAKVDGTWMGACASLFSSEIRGDAVWVNRSAMFDTITNRLDASESRTDANTLLAFILGEDFLSLPAPRKAKSKESGHEEEEDIERRQAVIASSKGAGQRTRHPFSHLFGAGNPFGKPGRTLLLRQKWHEYLKPMLEGAGIPLIAVGHDQKGKKNKNEDGPAHTELQREMFSKAASRLAQIWTKQRQQEYDRQIRKSADADLKEMEWDETLSRALSALNQYCENYRVWSGAEGEFLLRPRQTVGWDRVVAKWSTIAATDPDQAREKRIDAVKEFQDDPEKKFGDPNLFLRLADEAYRDVWWRDSKADHSILTRYVAGMKARSDAARLKVASYRHPDTYRNPIFCQFGVSRPKIEFRRLKAFTDKPSGNDIRAVGMLLWHPAANSAKFTVLHAVSSRVDREIGYTCDASQYSIDAIPVSRHTRLGMAAGMTLARADGADTPARVAGVFDLKSVRKRPAEENDDGEAEEKLKEPKWNGTLSASRHDLVAISDLLRRAAIASDVTEKEKARKQALRRREHLRWTLTVSMEVEGRGPWFCYVQNYIRSNDGTPFLRTVRKDEPKDKDDPRQGLKRRKGDTFISWDGWPWEEANKPLKEGKEGLVADASAARGDSARLILSRLPGLRVLSVDLGQRFAAACSVWETLSTDEFRKKIQRDGVRLEGLPEGLFVHVVGNRIKEEHGKRKEIEDRTVFRRIAEDFLRDNKTGELTSTPHPAPWARLDRQFLIKLQGEDQSAREASNEEIWLVHKLEQQMGLSVPLIDRLVQTGWGNTEKQSKRIGELKKFGWQPLSESESVLAHKKAPNGRKPPSLAVDELISATVQNARLALRRHADRGRIAFGLASDHKPTMGDRKYWFYKPQDDDPEPNQDAAKKAAERTEKHVEYLRDALLVWYDLAVSGKWRDDDAVAWWNAHILPLIQKTGFTEPPALNLEDQKAKDKRERHEKKVLRWKDIWANTLRKELACPENEKEDEVDFHERKADREAFSTLLKPVADELRKNANRREDLHRLWACRWLRDEGRRRQSLKDEVASNFRHDKSQSNRRGTTSAKVETSGWHSILGQFRDWLLPRGLRAGMPENDEKVKARKDRYEAARNVGGLSLTRIDTLVEFRRALVQFRTAGTPWGRVEIGPDDRPTEERREASENYAQHLLDVIDQLREQRSKQLASRIAEAALGIGSEKREHWEEGRRRSTHMLADKLNDPRFAPCHAVVIERLDNYKPDELRGKRENRMLAAWRKADFKKRLTETCQLHGLHLREVMPNYTSRQCSRTGLPGIRCDDVPVEEFLTAPWWRKRMKSAYDRKGKPTREQPYDEEHNMLVALDERWPAYKLVPETQRADYAEKVKTAKPLRLPRKGGDLFVAETSIRAVQADLNAAANIGLRALLDPDFVGKWWYVPCSTDGMPARIKVNGAACFETLTAELLKKVEKTATKRDYVNAWRNASTCHFAASDWKGTTDYWKGVRDRAVKALCDFNGIGKHASAAESEECF